MLLLTVAFHPDIRIGDLLYDASGNALWPTGTCASSPTLSVGHEHSDRSRTTITHFVRNATSMAGPKKAPQRT